MPHQTLNDREIYTDDNKAQLDKEASVSASKSLVTIIIEQLESILKTCEEYEPVEKSLRIHNAPAVKVNNQLVIAPDILCETENGKRFWIEAKDKCQRFYPPDTGADLHQVLGWYKIHKYLKEPVFVIFRDASLDECSEKKAEDNKKKAFEERWNLFKGNMYGAWLSELITLTDKPKYPKIFFERSREIPIYILYFYIGKMKKIDDVKVLFSNIPEEINELSVYRKCTPENSLHELHTEKELEQLMINNLRFIKRSLSTKYKNNTPFVEIEGLDLKKALYLGLKKMNKEHKGEDLKLEFFTDELCRRKNKILNY